MKLLRWPLMKNAITFLDRLRLSYFLLTSKKYTNGPRVRAFEQQWAKWVGSQYALMVSSGSTANFLLLAAVKEKFKFKDGDKVLVPACTWVTNVSPVIQLGFTPVFCDINLENYSFDPEHLAEIKKAHPDIKIIFITHLLGFSADNELYAKTFPDAVILDDLCESHGCQGPNGVKRGADSLGGTFSFYFGHHITTVEGGMINTNDRELYELMRLKRSHGMAREGDDFADYVKQYPDMHPQFLFMTDGYNFRSSDINAVIGQCQLPRLDNIIEKRKKNLKKFTNIIEANLDKFYPIIWQEGNSNYALPIICRTTEIATRMKAIFDANGVEHRPVVSGNLLHQPFLKGYKFGTPRKNATVDILHTNGVYIGNNHFITDSDLDWLADLLNSI